MNKFVRNLLSEWRRLGLPLENETIIVAVSGGADSVSLAIALNDLRLRRKLNHHFVIAHFNHNLRGRESEKDAEFVKDLAEKLQLDYKIATAPVRIENQPGNLEQNARNARYGFLGETAKSYQAFAVLTAHTQNDQAETFLFNLIRGSGLEGLSGISAMRDEKVETQDKTHTYPFKLVRPLLNWAKRADTEKFCLENLIEFRQDAMNNDLRFNRVRIRKEIVPLLQKINPRIIETLARTAGLLREDAQELRRFSQKMSEQIVPEDFVKLSKSRRMQHLRDWLRERRGNLRQLELKHLEAIDRLIFSPKSGRLVELPNGESVWRKQGKIFFEKSRVEKR